MDDYEFTLDYEPENDLEDEDDFDCGFIPGKGCLMAGTEDCDFDCPYRDRLVASPYYPNCDLLGNQANDPDED